jgi:hypothetical protein
MSIILENFRKAKEQFDSERNKEDGSKVMGKIINLVNELGQNWTGFNGGDLAEFQMKLAGYEFYLADYIADLGRISEQYKIEMKELRAKRWDDIAETIKAERGKVQNKDQIENILVLETKELQTQQILYETLFYKYKLKLTALRDILTAIVQAIAQKKTEIERSKSIN